MSKLIVDQLEIVDVQVEDGEAAALTSQDLLHASLDPIVKEHSVRKTREGVGHFAFCDVGERARDSASQTAAVFDRKSTAQHPSMALVPILHSQFGLKMARLAAQVGLEVGQNSFPIFSMDQNEPSGSAQGSNSGHRRPPWIAIAEKDTTRR